MVTNSNCLQDVLTPFTLFAAKAGSGKPVETGSVVGCEPDHVLKHVAMQKRRRSEELTYSTLLTSPLLTRGLLHVISRELKLHEKVTRASQLIFEFLLCFSGSIVSLNGAVAETKNRATMPGKSYKENLN